MRLLRAVSVLLVLRLISCTAVAAVDDRSARLDYVMRRLKTEGPGEGLIAGEWYLVSLSMAGIAAWKLGRADELRWLTERALQPDVRDFDSRRWRSDALATLDRDEGHAGYLGHLGLLLAMECSQAHAAQRRAVLEALSRRYRGSALLDTYPGEKWIPDNAVTLAAVAVGARCEERGGAGDSRRPSTPRPLRARSAQGERLWPSRDGLLMFTPRVGPRGSGAAWNSIYLPLIDPKFAAEQYAAAEARFGWRAFGFAAWREGIDGPGDVDSGPLVFGLSPSATGFAIAGASDRAGLLRTAEAAGVTVPWGGPHYLTAPLVGEAAVLAARCL